MKVPAPRSLDELLARAAILDGVSVGELAAQLALHLPDRAPTTKGRPGQLLEQALGASAGSRDVPDFEALGVELKTVPIDQLGRVRESTFVCSLDLGQAAREEWESSRVRRKLGCVLWFPLQAGPEPLAGRRFGTPRLWRPTLEQEARLRSDWEQLIGRIAAGGIEQISAHAGEILQIRPKARDGSRRVTGVGPEGEPLAVVPRGFYLRARFTESILWDLSGPTAR